MIDPIDALANPPVRLFTRAVHQSRPHEKIANATSLLHMEECTSKPVSVGEEESLICENIFGAGAQPAGVSRHDLYAGVRRKFDFQEFQSAGDSLVHPATLRGGEPSKARASTTTRIGGPAHARILWDAGPKEADRYGSKMPIGETPGFARVGVDWRWGLGSRIT
jgi:hypothetical protein